MDDEIKTEEQLDIFRIDPEFEKNEKMWTAIKKEILGESDSDSDDDGSSSGSDSSSDDEEEDDAAAHAAAAQSSAPIQDMTEQDLS
ncbi:hypothetical protein P43SY_010328 [Pythium insidiosum]|uniref:Uncharacterized protein n=1 Tax=Pythium insidiosum TaxID=114742 RepID=A0AAD5PZU0_PYTIN|nr:hypothetical protein P43SY_010328 [Pythium insidiosum]